jgi:uncharacterized SAM-binding protein YcdF (DUF218 family)
LFALVVADIYIDTWGHQDRARPAQAIIVLGAGVLSNGKASISLRERTEHAVTLYQRGLAPYIIFTGGVGTHPPAESLVAAEIAYKQGVPRDKVLWEEKSTSTRENAKYTAEICRERGWTRIIVVSQPFHLWRARRDFEHAGLTAYTSPVLNPEVDKSLWFRFVWTSREAALALRDLFRF